MAAVSWQNCAVSCVKMHLRLLFDGERRERDKSNEKIKERKVLRGGTTKQMGHAVAW